MTALVGFAIACNLLEVVVLLAGCVDSQNTVTDQDNLAPACLRNSIVEEMGTKRNTKMSICGSAVDAW